MPPLSLLNTSHPASPPTPDALATKCFQANVCRFISAFKNPQPNRKLNFNLKGRRLKLVTEPAHLRS